MMQGGARGDHGAQGYDGIYGDRPAFGKSANNFNDGATEPMLMQRGGAPQMSHRN